MRAICSIHIASASRPAPRPERLRAKERVGALVGDGGDGWQAGWLASWQLGARAWAMGRESRYVER
jgi:hypothetical protein